MGKPLDKAPSCEEKVTAKNGIPIYYYRNNNLHSFCICLYIKAGSLYEADDSNGSTHFWEHILFRKLNRIYEGRFYHTLDMLGLTFSASTYKEFVAIKITGAVKHFNKAADIIAQVFTPIHLNAKEVELERKRIKAEIREGDEKSSLDYFTQQIIWAGTPLQNTIAGQYKVLDKLGVGTLQGLQDAILSAGNLFFYVTGCFDDKSIGYLSEHVGEHIFAGNQPVHQNIAAIPETFFNRNALIEVKNSYYNYMRFSFDIDVSRYSHPELDLIYDILFSGDTSKIYQALSENTGYIYSYDAALEKYENIGNMYFSFEIQRKNIFLAIEKVIEILKELKTQVTDALSFVLPCYTDNAEFMLDNDADLNWSMAYECHILNCQYAHIYQRKTAYEQVTPERIMQIANEIFRPENLVLTLKTDKLSFNIEEAQKVLFAL